MGVFFVLFLFPMMIQHFTVKGYDKREIDYPKKNRIALLCFFAFLTCLVMFRHESVGTDTRTYMFFFEKYLSVSWGEISASEFDIGFSYFNKVVSLVSENQQVFIAVSAIITVAMIYPTYKRLCEDTSLTIVLFGTMSTFVMMFSGIRQMLAIGIGFISYHFTRNKKLIPFILTVILAMSFHTSAFMLVFMYPIYHAKITKKWLFAVIPSVAVVFVFNKQIFSVLALFVERYTDYDASMTQTGAYTMLILFVMFAVFSFLIPEESNLDDETIGLRNFLLLALVVQIFAPLHMLAMRMSYYYIIFIPLLLPKIILYRSEKWAQVAVVSRHVMVAFFFLYFFLNAYRGGNLKVFPYHFFWENVQ